jgi:hypothetical protein
MSARGDFLIRTVPVQTAGTRRAAKDFGHASSRAKLLRMLLLPLLPNPKDRNMQNRLVTAMAKVLTWRKDEVSRQEENNPLSGFRFVPGSSLEDCSKFKLLLNHEADGNLKVGIPAMNPLDSIVAPAGTSRVQFRLMGVAFHPDKEESVAGTPEVIDIPYTDGEQAANSVVLQLEAAAEMITVVALELSYWKGNERIHDAGFMPVEIIGVLQ